LYEIGIQIPTVNAFAKFFTSCLNENTRTVYFAQEKMARLSLKSTQRSYSSFGNWNSFAYANIAAAVESSYSTVFKNKQGQVSGQLKRFNDIFNDLNKAKKYIHDDPNKSKLFFARGHLCANANQPLETWRKATFFYLNHVPQWQKLNQGSWLAVENHVRKLSNTGNYVITTGGHDQLQIENAGISMVANNLMQAPKYMWKLVQDASNPAQGVAFVIRNFPYPNNFPNLCNDNMNYCQKVFGNKYNTADNGFLTCCSVTGLKNAIHYDPRVHKIATSPRKMHLEVLFPTSF
jgi:DNA/RNA endonuclease G (NUC1)